MNSLIWVIEFFLHIDKVLLHVVNQYGTWTYAILFGVIFVETGVVICPFLPGDSLLFAAGAIAAHNNSGINIGLLLLLVFSAAVLGDNINYWIGRTIGKTLEKHHLFNRMINAEKMAKAEAFFNRYGGFAIFLGRFIPFIRTFMPFVSGGSRMRYPYFLLFDVIGGAVWTSVGLFAGFFFGRIPVIQQHFSLIMVLIVVISLLPVFIVWIKQRFGGKFSK
ncbi:VTT domain-containing protein [Sporolactobacillus spathodeae]|uniref:Membrane-associated protein n=1 Tax=Sporolactobacillus spathodeae TaxID=1465502 RepID=A0ABS2Q5Q8_9BACL|nr:VTT domain-containing protein [Sporolactobacillus spathodeae]MBM7657122.1 membrane-associated protein [Sporolactobacillus spathodeae]